MSHPKPVILLVDDTPTNLELAADVLGTNHEILVATHGAEALDIARGEHPDLILMDVMMPGMDGVTACRLLKEEPHTRDIPVIFLTALTDTEALVRGFEAGGVDFISKPFHPAELRVRVETHLALKRARDEERALRLRLEEALGRVKQLSGLLPICAQCKKIRDPEGDWNHLETYISAHSEAGFTHGLCPDCAQAFLES